MAGYNHYTPQSDGSYRRSTVPEPPRRSGPRAPYPAQPPQPAPSPPPEPVSPPDPPRENSPHPVSEPACVRHEEQGILSFLRGLLPRQIDAADLLVISLLLLMNREEGESGMSPLLTIALYFLL